MAKGLHSTGANPWRIIGRGFAIALILTPAVGMQFSTGVKRSLFDFAFAASMIVGTGLLIELAVRSSGKLIEICALLWLGSACLFRTAALEGR